MILERKTAEELTTIARDVVTNVVYVAWTDESLQYSFAPFLMMVSGAAAAQGDDIDWMNDIGLVYERVDKQTGMGVNGYPTFLSAQYMHREDRIPFNRECIRLSVALGQLDEAVLTKFDLDVASHAAAEVVDESDDEEEGTQ